MTVTWVSPTVIGCSGSFAGPDSAASSYLLEETDAAGRTNRISSYGKRPTTLYLAPTKALAADQAAALERLTTAVESVQRAAGVPRDQVRTLRTGTCDGDTPLPERDWARAHADVVLTNPDFLHFSLLPAWRGAAPVQRALIAGDAVLGASVFQLVPELDAGDGIRLRGAVSDERDAVENDDVAGFFVDFAGGGTGALQAAWPAARTWASSSA